MSKVFCWDLGFLRRNCETVQKQQPELPFDLYKSYGHPATAPSSSFPFQFFFSRFLLSAIEVWDPLVSKITIFGCPFKQKKIGEQQRDRPNVVFAISLGWLQEAPSLRRPRDDQWALGVPLMPLPWSRRRSGGRTLFLRGGGRPY